MKNLILLALLMLSISSYAAETTDSIHTDTMHYSLFVDHNRKVIIHDVTTPVIITYSDRGELTMTTDGVSFRKFAVSFEKFERDGRLVWKYWGYNDWIELIMIDGKIDLMLTSNSQIGQSYHMSKTHNKYAKSRMSRFAQTLRKAYTRFRYNRI